MISKITGIEVKSESSTKGKKILKTIKLREPINCRQSFLSDELATCMHQLKNTIWLMECMSDDWILSVFVLIGPYQCGFRAVKSTNDQLFTLRQITAEDTRNADRHLPSVYPLQSCIRQSDTTEIIRCYGLVWYPRETDTTLREDTDRHNVFSVIRQKFTKRAVR